VSADGSKLAVVGGNKAYFLDRQSLKVERLADLPWPASEATFALSGNDLFGLSRQERGERSGGAAVVRFSGVTGVGWESRCNGGGLPLGPTILRVAQAPR